MNLFDHYTKKDHVLHIPYLQIGFKPAGGIKTVQDLLEWMTLVKEILGNDWFTNIYFRIGASSLLDNIISEIEEKIKE